MVLLLLSTFGFPPGIHVLGFGLSIRGVNLIGRDILLKALLLLVGIVVRLFVVTDPDFVSSCYISLMLNPILILDVS